MYSSGYLSGLGACAFPNKEVGFSSDLSEQEPQTLFYFNMDLDFLAKCCISDLPFQKIPP